MRRKNLFGRHWVLAWLLVAGIGSAWGREGTGDVIAAIEFSGNELTRDRVLLQEMTVKVGDRADPEAIERSRQAIMNLGLFKSVRADLGESAEGKVLRITVEEKLYILPLPRLDAKPDGSYSYGMELVLNNVAGLNQRVKLIYLQKESADRDAALKKEATLQYSYPRVAGSVYQFGLGLRFEREDQDVPDNDQVIARYRHDTRNVSVGVSRWLAPRGPSRGWYAGGGLVVRQEDYTHLWGAAQRYSDGQAVSATFDVGYYDVREFPYRREGQAFGYAGQLGLPPLASDYSFNRSLFYYRAYRPVGASGANLNGRVQFGLANGRPFGEDAYSLGGATSLRGYESGYASGNAFALANVEYLHPVSGYPQMRAVGFVDVGNVYPGVMEADLGSLLTGIGVGLRWRVQSLVNVTLTLDAAYGVDADTRVVYLSTSGTF